MLQNCLNCDIDPGPWWIWWISFVFGGFGVDFVWNSCSLAHSAARPLVRPSIRPGPPVRASACSSAPPVRPSALPPTSVHVLPPVLPTAPRPSARPCLRPCFSCMCHMHHMRHCPRWENCFSPTPCITCSTCITAPAGRRADGCIRRNGMRPRSSPIRPRGVHWAPPSSTLRPYPPTDGGRPIFESTENYFTAH